jgi:DNA-binding transcriptional regulator YdaS (Cro superfamily)
MNLHEWIDAKPGRSAWIAQKLSVTPSSVSQWRKAGVPVGHMETLADLTANDVTVTDMLAHLHECAKARKATA